jgi:hypothetical protein
MTRLVRNGDGPVFTSTAPEWLEALLLRGKLIARLIGAEDRECILFADRLREAALNGRLRATFTHIPHEVGGGTKNAALRYSLAAALGFVAGSTDYVFVWKGGGCWIEFKRPTVARTAATPRKQGGAMSTKQRLFRSWCERVEVPHHVVTSARDGLDLLAGYGVYDPAR